ncbi:MAG: diaminobutyrate acetyltransferase, partial [SAR324 cluster bacterium]|nr:diaminobutyrate acetyltransferase [SAR324 cluster bacterium]
ECLFVWQVAISPEFRGKRLANQMLDWLLKQEACLQVTSVETTISPSNKSSGQLFSRFAETWGASIKMGSFLAAAAFEDKNHEAENLYHISPIKRKIS